MSFVQQCRDYRGGSGQDYVRLQRHQLFREFSHSINIASGPAIRNPHITAAGPPKSSINFANDYLDFYTYAKGKMPAQYFHMALDGTFLTDAVTRANAIGQAKLKTLAFLYYVQDPRGLNNQHWAIADDEFGDITTTADFSDDIPRTFKSIEALMPPFPYVRESRRIQAVTMLTAASSKNPLAMAM